MGGWVRMFCYHRRRFAARGRVGVSVFRPPVGEFEEDLRRRERGVRSCLRLCLLLLLLLPLLLLLLLLLLRRKMCSHACTCCRCLLLLLLLLA